MKRAGRQKIQPAKPEASFVRPDEVVRAYVALHGGLCAGLLGRVFRGALGLQLLGVKNAVAAKTAIGQGLGVVFESVRRRFGPAVNHGQKLIDKGAISGMPNNTN